MSQPRSAIIGTGSFIAEDVIKNEAFITASFYDKNGSFLSGDNHSVVEKFKSITGIAERRYAVAGQNASDIGYLAAKDAITSCGIDKETLDCIIVAHNFGDVDAESNRVSQVPSLASRIKSQLAIANPACVAYDILFGCPGWLQGVIQANYFIGSGDMKRCLVIGAETLSRVCDPHDRDSMIYSDGSGAVVLEASMDANVGVLSHSSRTFSEYASLLATGKSYASEDDENIYLKMNGRKVYEFCLANVPGVIKDAMDKAGITIQEVNKILIHQANGKMDYAILSRLLELYGNPDVSPDIMPMTIEKLGNSSVATVPTMLDMILKNKLENHTIKKDDIVVMASVGAGMNVNALVYRF